MFSVGGLVAGIGATLFLWFFVGAEASFAVLGFRDARFYFAFPPTAALIAGAVAWWYFRQEKEVTPKDGALVALLSFVAFCVLLAAIGPSFGAAAPAFILFGLVLFGWAIVIFGAGLGWLANKVTHHAP